MTNLDEEDEVIYEGKGKTPMGSTAGKGESAKQPEHGKTTSTTGPKIRKGEKAPAGTVKRMGAALNTMRKKADDNCSVQ